MTNTICKTDDLEEKLYYGEIRWLEYAQQSAEYCEEYRLFCMDYGLTADNLSAEQFFDWLLESEKEAHIYEQD